MSIQSSCRNITARLIRNGHMVQKTECELCGFKGGWRNILQVHHLDYADPTTVMWLCGGCHQKWHVKNGPALNADLTETARSVRVNGTGGTRRASYVKELKSQVKKYGAYQGPFGMIKADKELRDALFMRGKWSIKAMMRERVTLFRKVR